MFAHFHAAVARSRATGTAYTLLLVLAYRANEEGWVQATVGELARAAHASRASVQRALRRLAELGELEVRESGRRGHLMRLRIAPMPAWDEAVGVWGLRGTPGPQNEAPSGAEGPQIEAGGSQNEAPGPQNEAGGHQNEAPYIDKETTRKQEETKETSSSRPPTREEEAEVCLVEEALGRELAERLRRVAAPRSGDERWRAWLEMVLRPELERLGEREFRAAVRAALAEAAGPDVRFPARLVEVRLKQADPGGGKLLLGEAPEEALEAILSPTLLEEDPGGDGGLGESARALLEAVGINPACPHCGAEPPRSDCCVPRAREQVLRFYPIVLEERRSPVVDRESLEGYVKDLVRAGRKLIREGYDPAGEADPEDRRVLQAGLRWVEWALGVIRSKAGAEAVAEVRGQG